MAEAGIRQRRNILVTGGTSGLGRLIATGFAGAGDAVMICARTEADCDRVAREISDASSGTCAGIPCDVSKVQDIESLAQEVSSRFGALHTLVNNASSVAPGPIEGVREKDWDRVVDTNLKAVFFMIQKMIPFLRKGARPDWPASIINIGSVAAIQVGPRPHPPYMAAKAGMHYVTKSLAKSFAPDHVNVNAIALGVFPQDSVIMRGYDEEALNAVLEGIPAGRFGEGKDIVGLTQFLASSASSYITGATIPLDGGMHL